MFDVLLLFPTQRYSNFILHFIAKALHRPQRSADIQSGGNSVNTSSLPYIEVLRGQDGRDGRDGVPGPRGLQGQKGVQGLKGDHGVAGPPGPRSGGVVYTRWGKVAVQVSQVPHWCMQGGMVEHGVHKREEQPTTSACLMIQTISATHPEFKGTTLCSEQSMRHTQEHHCQLFLTTMSPVPCAMLQQG